MIKWNSYTQNSKWASLIFFILVLPVLTFYIGTQYEKTIGILNRNTNDEPNTQVAGQADKNIRESNKSISTSTIAGNPLTVNLSSCGDYNIQTCFGSGATPVEMTDKNLEVYGLVSTAIEARFGIVDKDANYILTFDTGMHQYTDDEYSDYVLKIADMFRSITSFQSSLGEFRYVCKNGAAFSLAPSFDMKTLNIISASTSINFPNNLLTVSLDKSNIYYGKDMLLVGVGESVTITLKNSSSTLMCNPVILQDEAPLNFGDIQ